MQLPVCGASWSIARPGSSSDANSHVLLFMDQIHAQVPEGPETCSGIVCLTLLHTPAHLSKAAFLIFKSKGHHVA